MGFRDLRTLIVACLATLAAGSGFAHEIGTTRVAASFQRDHTYSIEVVAAAQTTLNRLERSAGLPRSNALSAEGLDRQLRSLQREILDAADIRFDDKRVAPHLGLAVADGEIRLRLTGEIPSGARIFRWRYALASGSYALTVDGGEPVWVEADAASGPFRLADQVAPPSLRDTISQYLVLGFTHILPHGLDHILFVLGMFLLTARVRDVLAQVTAFTVAHSITLGMTMYGAVSVSPRIVEPAIALSIAYIAVENVVATKLKPWRVGIVFCFGLLHGMGFAGVLQELGLPRSQFLPALISFNLGVEAGQLTIIVAAFALFAYWWQAKPWYRERLVIPASMAIGAAGLVWTVQRLFP